MIAEVTDEGRAVNWVRSVFVPETERCFCMFDAPDSDTGADVNRRANIPYLAIREILEMADAAS